MSATGRSSLVKWIKRPGFVLAACSVLWVSSQTVAEGLVSAGAEVEKLADGFKFTEGPAADGKGSVYFTDIPNNRIHKWNIAEKKLSTFREDSGGANGLYFGPDGTLYACEGVSQRIAAVSADGKNSKALAETYDGKPFNKPNDLWVDAKGGIYFTDPNYGRDKTSQDGEHVYYLSPDRKKVLRVADDFRRPNGIVGTPDGKTLYITDRTGKKTFRYKINDDGTLSDKTLFAEVGSDGMTLDAKGNLYTTLKHVTVFSPDGKQIAEIKTPKPPSNVCFGGPGRTTLFITARDGFYAVKMAVAGAAPAGADAAAGGVRKITITCVQEMLKYDKDQFTVKAGQKVELTFVNNDFPPHNLLIVAPGSADEIAKMAIDLGPKGFDVGFVPKSPKVLHVIKMIDFEESEVLKFTAPKKPGDYPYVCTFPGHAMMMRGVMHVVK